MVSRDLEEYLDSDLLEDDFVSERLCDHFDSLVLDNVTLVLESDDDLGDLDLGDLDLGDLDLGDFDLDIDLATRWLLVLALDDNPWCGDFDPLLVAVSVDSSEE